MGLSNHTTAHAQAVPDTVEAILVGRTETAQVRIIYGGDAPIVLETTLPLRVGGAKIPAGRFELRVDASGAEAIVVVLKAVKGEDGKTVGEEVYARESLRVTSTGGNPARVGVRIQSQRHAEDTVRTISQSRAGLNRTIREIVPGTTWTLVILSGGTTYTVAIAAR
jgi:hypothetical protein